MNPYRVFVRMEASEALRSIRGIQRASLAAFIESLSTEPDTKGDYSERDETGRDLEIKVVGSFAITFWPDHAEKEVKVVDVRRADRA